MRSQFIGTYIKVKDVTNFTVSISITVLKAFSDKPEIGARKFPAAPTFRFIQHVRMVEALFGG